jgi:hypothetical protein
MTAPTFRAAAQVLEVLLGAVGMRPGQSASQRAANCTAVAMAALAGLVPLARRSRSEGGAGDKVAGKVLQLASCMLEDQVGLGQQRFCSSGPAVYCFAVCNKCQ